MKPQRFSIGQPITPKVGSSWPMTGIGANGLPPQSPPSPLPEMPKQGEIYHVSGYQAYDDGIWGIFLSEYNYQITFNEEKFDPIDLSAKEISDLVSESISIEQETL